MGTILVTGGTGNLGRHVLPHLLAAGAEVRTLSRRGSTLPDADHRTGDLLRDEVGTALEGVETVLHLAGSWSGDDRATVNLLRAARVAGVEHIVFISVIGADAVPLGYQRRKHRSELLLEQSGVPWTILRAAQFHDLMQIVARALTRLPVAVSPGGMRAEPVDVSEVAARLAALALGPPAGRVPDLAGPRVLPMSEILHGYLVSQSSRRRIVDVLIPGAVGRAYRTGANLAGPDATRGTVSWEDFLRANTAVDDAAT